MNEYKHVSDFPADTKWVQLPNEAIAVLPNGRVFRMGAGIVKELQARETQAKSPADTDAPEGG